MLLLFLRSLSPLAPYFLHRFTQLFLDLVPAGHVAVEALLVHAPPVVGYLAELGLAATEHHAGMVAFPR